MNEQEGGNAVKIVISRSKNPAGRWVWNAKDHKGRLLACNMTRKLLLCDLALIGVKAK